MNRIERKEMLNLIPPTTIWHGTARHGTARITSILTWGEEISRGTKRQDCFDVMGVVCLPTYLPTYVPSSIC